MQIKAAGGCVTLFISVLRGNAFGNKQSVNWNQRRLPFADAALFPPAAATQTAAARLVRVFMTERPRCPSSPEIIQECEAPVCKVGVELAAKLASKVGSVFVRLSV